MKHTRLYCIMVIALVLALAGPLGATHTRAAGALRLFGTIGSGYSGSSQLVELNPNTGALISVIGSVGYIVNGLDYDPVSGNLYASTSVNDVNFRNGLISIDISSGAGTPLVQFPFGDMAVTNIRADASGTLYAWDENLDSLTRIDPLTGNKTLVGYSGIGTLTYGMSFDASNILYFFNPGTIYTINTTTGAVTVVASFIGIAHHGDFHPVTNRYWGIDRSWSNPRFIQVINQTTGAVEASLPTVDNLHTLAFTSAADVTPPVVSVPADQIVEATSAAGADVTFSASATDETSPASPVVTCVPPSGSTFPIATTTVNCSAGDDAGNVGTASFNITVQDTTPPSLNLPANMTVLPSGPAGAIVNFTVTATDAVDPSPDIACTPPSGSTFPIATTTVNCTATDDAGNVASGSFTVTVGGTAYTLSLRSYGPYDGTLRESTEFSGVSNFAEAASFLITAGDDAFRRQYMGMLDFNTSSLPDGAIITAATLQIKVSYLSTNLYTKLGDLMAEVAVPYFGTLPNLQTLDFASAAAANAGNFSRAASGNTWITLNMDPASLFAVDPTGRTQFRLRFPLDDSNDTLKHDIRIFSGNYLNAAYRPLLTITYYMP